MVLPLVFMRSAPPAWGRSPNAPRSIGKKAPENIHTCRKENKLVSSLPFSMPAAAKRSLAQTSSADECDRMLKALFNNLIGRVGDKWTMIILEVLREHGELRFTQLPHVVRWRRSGDADAVASRHRERRHGDANPGQLMCSTQ